MTTLRKKAHDELDLIPEEAIEQVVDMIISFRNKGEDVNHDSVDRAFGMMHQYANLDKISLEEGAFERAMVKKHEVD